MSHDASLATLLQSRFARFGSKPAFQCPDGRRLGYGDLSAAVQRYAGALAEAGVRPGDRVTVQAEKSIETAIVYLATLQAGAVFNPLNTGYTPAEVAYFIEDAEPAVLIATGDRRSDLEPIARRNGARAVLTLEADGSGTLAEAAGRAEPLRDPVPRAASDLAALVYTSGTTGRSKGAMITHGNLTSNALTLADIWGFRSEDRLLHALPIFHVHGLFVALNTAFLSGASLLWLERFDLEAILSLLPQASVMMGVPTFYTRLLGSSAFGRDHCATMRLLISGSAPLLAETHEAFTARTGMAILERYGMTETGMITSNPLLGERVAGSVGYALPGVEVRVCDASGRERPRVEIGVVEVRGPNVFQGYWRMPEKTREDIRPSGFFITGDQGVMAEDGRLTLVGREKDMIITGGLNVYPIEIEQAINALPGVGESAVIGVPHPDFGEGVVAVVSPLPGQHAPQEAEVIAALSRTLAKFKLPKRVLIVPDLPRNAMGKVQKAELRRQFQRLF